MIIKGYVEKVQEYPSKYTDKFGKPKPSMWAMYVDNTRYSCGIVRPPAVGTYISFESTQDEKGYWNADGSTIKQEAAQQAASPPTHPEPKAAGAIFVDNRQDSIIYQSSRKDALEWTGYLLQHGLIDFGKAKGAQKIELAEIFLDNYTKRFFDDCKRLSPPEHNSPVDAELPDGVQELAKPARKAKAVVETSSTGDFEDDLPF